jgi:DNA primase
VNVRRTLERLRIDVLLEHGHHLTARCPSGAHDDKHPSWRVRIDGDKQGLHHCQACKFGGDLVDLVKHVKGYGTRTAAKAWIDKEGQEASPEDLRAPQVRLRVALAEERAFKLPAGVEVKPFERWSTAPARYARERGIDEEQANKWGLGYAVHGRLSGRLVVPVRDAKGRLASYMARTFVGADRRYLYPREEEHADHDVLFGEEHWRGQPNAVLTEGALKSLAVDRLGIPDVAQAAIGGSGVRPMHVAKLEARFKRVVVLTDNDPAGNDAGERMVMALRAGRFQAVRAKLEPGEDPDSVEPGRLGAVVVEALR